MYLNFFKFNSYYDFSGESGTNNIVAERPGQPPQHPLPHPQQAPPTSQSPSLPPYGTSGGPTLPGQQQQYPGQMSSYGALSGPNIPRSTPQPSASADHHNQISSQSRYSNPLTNPADFTEPPLSGKPSGPTSSSNTIAQQSFGGPPLPGQPQAQGQPPVNHQPLGQPPVNHQSLGQPSIGNQQTMSGAPLAGPYSATPISNRQNLSGLPLSGPIQGPPTMSQQGLSRPPLPGQTGNLSGPPLPGQQNLASPYIQQNISGPPSLPGQQNLHSQYPYNNQMTEQRRFSPSPSMPGQQNISNSYGHLNHQHPETNYPLGYQQQNYSQPGQTVSRKVIFFVLKFIKYSYYSE